MDNIVDYCESSPEEPERDREVAEEHSERDVNDQNSDKSSTSSSSSEDGSPSPKTVEHKRSNNRERSWSRSPPRRDYRGPPYRRNSYGRRSRSGSRDRDRRRRSRSGSRDRDRRRQSRSGSQEWRRRSSRSRSPDRRGRYRSPPRQYQRSPPSRHRRGERSPVSSRRYPSTPVVTSHTLGRTPSGGDALSGTLSNIPGDTPEQKLENALTTMNQRQAKYGGMTALQFQAVQEKRKQLWKKKTPVSSATHWDAYAATFSQPSSTAGTSDANDEDPQAKFRRLMGMKGEGKATVNQDITQKSSEIINKQNKLLADLDQQYEESRFLTHRARGVGFGFGGTVLSNLAKTQDVVNEKGPEDK